MSDKPKFPRGAAIEVARTMVQFLSPWCERLIVAGSLRRRKQTVGDIEILYIPKFTCVPDGLFDQKQINLVDVQLSHLLSFGTITKRTTILGSETWGPRNKLARHTSSQIPVDFFQATSSNWFNYLVCRTGSAVNNMHIAEAKSMRNLTENAVAVAGRAVQNAPDPVRTLADAARLPKTQAAPLQTARQGPTRPPVNPQFNPLSQFNKLACKAPKSVSNLCERPGCPQKPCHLAIFHARLHNPLINGLFRTVSP
jgi:hypothetical protein